MRERNDPDVSGDEFIDNRLLADILLHGGDHLYVGPRGRR